MKNIASALVKAQRDFSPALKTSSNPHFRSKYADLSACVEAVIDALNNNGIMLMQKCRDDDAGVCVETVFVHESGEVLEAGALRVPAAKQDAQGYGSALTYARRYSLMAACGIAPEDDDGNAASQTQKAQTSRPSVDPFADDRKRLKACKTLQELASAWNKTAPDAKHVLAELKEQMKADFEAMVSS